MKNGKITICRHGLIDEDYISLEILDCNSSSSVIKVKITLDEFARALTNLSHCKCNYEVNKKDIDIWGKVKEVKTVFFDNPNKYSNKEKTKENVKKHFEENYGNTEWKIWSDGTTQQQNDELYHYIICRYVEESEAK